MKTPITPEQQAALQAKGYVIEDLNDYNDEELAGCYRWLNSKHTEDGGDGFGVVQYSVEDAWADAAQFDANPANFK